LHSSAAVEIGGGTIVRLDEALDQVTVGPDSVGYELLKRGLIFGGDTLTATDVAVKLGRYEWKDAQTEKLSESICRRADEIITQDIEDAIGAALGEVSGETERIYSLDEMSYEEAKEDARNHAIEQAVQEVGSALRSVLSSRQIFLRKGI
jgi:N-methylhydantoinase A/oxoprolinase/acetone carboxylase beta subunit